MEHLGQELVGFLARARYNAALQDLQRWIESPKSEGRPGSWRTIQTNLVAMCVYHLLGGLSPPNLVAMCLSSFIIKNYMTILLVVISHPQKNINEPSPVQISVKRG